MLTPFKSAYRVTSPFGYRMLNGENVYHAGIDLYCDNRSVVSTCDGRIVSSTMITDRANRTWEWGNYVCVLADSGERIFYCHLEKRLVSVGQRVKTGDAIGVMGNTGYSFGVHLHYEVRRNNISINAADFLGIKNKIGQAVAVKTTEEKAEETMTKDEILKAIGDEWIKRFEDLPEWAKPEVRQLLDMGIINGGTANDPDDINMFMSDIKTILACRRMLG